MSSNPLDAGIRAIIAEVVRDEVQRAVRTALRPDELLTTAAAARVAGVAAVTIRRWASLGRLTPHKAGRVIRISRRELERLLKGGARASNDSTPEELAAKMFR